MTTTGSPAKKKKRKKKAAPAGGAPPKAGPPATAGRSGARPAAKVPADADRNAEVAAERDGEDEPAGRRGRRARRKEARRSGGPDSPPSGDGGSTRRDRRVDPRPETNDWVQAEGRGWFPRPDSTRPHVRLGVLWFLVSFAALAGGPVALAGVYGVVAAVGGAQVATAWRRRGRRPNVLVAALGAAALPLGAVFGSEGVAVAILVATAASVVVAPGSVLTLLGTAGHTVQSWLFIGLAAAAPVLVADMDRGVAIALLVLIAAYDCGDYLVGTDARWVVVGPLAGWAAVAVLSFSLFVVPVFGGDDVFFYAATLAVLAPLGQLAASAVLPDGRAVASGLRRLDSLLLAGPAWVVMLWVAPPG